MATSENASSKQAPVKTQFDKDSTALAVVAGIDLAGKLALVTGGYSGLGLETTRALASAGATVVVPSRRPEHAKQALTDLANLPGSIEIDTLDLGDLGSVRDFAKRFLATGRSIDLMINNAGVMACPETRLAHDWEAQFATNHLGHFALTNLLYRALKQDGGGRLVSLSSTGHKLSPIRFDDPMFMDQPYDKWVAYGQAKTANALFAVHLDALAMDDGVRAFSVHPGGILTPLQRHLAQEEMQRLGWIDENGTPLPIFKSPEQGASTTVWAATSEALNGMGGLYLEDCNVAAPTDPSDTRARYRGIDPHATDPEAAERLWTLSAELTGVDAF